ncbi:YiiX/YebB-like N1pC/P60 family cysteine hydrolase [Kingella potus]|uniref:YiiX/YebB-like N1pC/P60 family cysteine hydrolase n=1 Tax=Kingella potus TaxID=265175 RepID=UPI001FD29555|nr:YiiX/YebB-like N1pC/P60 family cysteine hydrolase [Kingella potus]UOO99993.1 hypothetical protein LVJ84_08170 [Kingella potus]
MCANGTHAAFKIFSKNEKRVRGCATHPTCRLRLLCFNTTYTYYFLLRSDFGMHNSQEKKNGYIIYYDQLKAGDIILTAENSLISKGVRCATNSQFSHVMMMINQSSYIHAISSGVQSGNIQRLIIEKPEYIRVLRLNKSEIDLENIISYLRKNISKPYSVSNAINAKFKIPFDFNSLETKRYCSQLVALAYEEAGIKLVKDANHCTPKEIAQSKNLIDVYIELTSLQDPIIDQNYLNQIFQPNLLDEFAKIENNAVNEVSKLSKTKLSRYSITDFLCKNPNYDNKFVEVFDKHNYFEFYNKFKQANKYRYGDFQEFVQGLNKQDPGEEVARLRKMAEELTTFHENALVVVKQNYQHFPLHFFKKEVELQKNLCEMYGQLLDNCIQFNS